MKAIVTTLNGMKQLRTLLNKLSLTISRYSSNGGLHLIEKLITILPLKGYPKPYETVRELSMLHQASALGAECE